MALMAIGFDHIYSIKHKFLSVEQSSDQTKTAIGFAYEQLCPYFTSGHILPDK